MVNLDYPGDERQFNLLGFPQALHGVKGTAVIVYRSPNHPDFDPKPEMGEEPPMVAAGAFTPLPMGLGDLVEMWAKPLGCWLDVRTHRLPKCWRTSLCGCMACSGRKARLNAWLPDLRRWKGGWQVACKRVADPLKEGLKTLFRPRL